MSNDKKNVCELYSISHNFFPSIIFYLERFSNLRNHVVTEDNLCHKLLAVLLYEFLDCTDEDVIDITVERDN